MGNMSDGTYEKEGLILKEFDQELNDKYDIIGKETCDYFLSDQFYELVKNGLVKIEILSYREDEPKLADIKITFFKEGGSVEVKKVKFVEPEVKDGGGTGWDSMLKYGTVHIPARKKWCKADYFVVIKHSLDELLVCQSKKATKCPPIKKKCQPNGKIGSFFDVPLKICAFYKLKDNHWIMTKKEGEDC